jgi:hypothetical protein
MRLGSYLSVSCDKMSNENRNIQTHKCRMVVERAKGGDRSRESETYVGDH